MAEWYVVPTEKDPLTDPRILLQAFLFVCRSCSYLCEGFSGDTPFFQFLIQLNQIVQSLRETTAPFASLSVSLTDIIRAKSVTWKEQEARAGYNVCPQHSYP